MSGISMSGVAKEADFERFAINLSSALSAATPPLSPNDVTVTQQNGKIVFTNNKGERIQINGSGADAVAGGIKESEGSGTRKASEYHGLMGQVNIYGWKKDGLGKSITIDIEGVGKRDFNLDDYDCIDGCKKSLVNAINTEPGLPTSYPPVASVVSGRLVLQAEGKITVTGSGVKQVFGYDDSIPNHWQAPPAP